MTNSEALGKLAIGEFSEEQAEEVQRQNWIAEVQEQERRDILGTKYTVDSMREFMSLDIPPREYLLFPFIQEKGLSMLYAERGVGKTFVGLSMALTVASGISIMNFSAPAPQKVLYIDGEMPAKTIQERIDKLAMGLGEGFIGADNLMIFTPDRQEDPMPNLSRPDDQAEVDKLLADGIKLVIIDNLSALCSFGRENEAESWQPMQTWLLSLRRRGISALLIDHAGKNGSNRGTSKKQDILDSVICLKKPQGCKQSEGARFIVEYQKSRGICGEVVENYEAQLCKIENGDGLQWQISGVKLKPEKLAERAKALELSTQGKSCRKIGEEMGIGRTKAGELVKAAKTMEVSAEPVSISISDRRTVAEPEIPTAQPVENPQEFDKWHNDTIEDWEQDDYSDCPF